MWGLSPGTDIWCVIFRRWPTWHHHHGILRETPACIPGFYPVYVVCRADGDVLMTVSCRYDRSLCQSRGLLAKVVDEDKLGDVLPGGLEEKSRIAKQDSSA